MLSTQQGLAASLLNLRHRTVVNCPSRKISRRSHVRRCPHSTLYMCGRDASVFQTDEIAGKPTVCLMKFLTASCDRGTSRIFSYDDVLTSKKKKKKKERKRKRKTRKETLSPFEVSTTGLMDTHTLELVVEC